MLMHIKPALLTKDEEDFFGDYAHDRRGPTSIESLKYLQSHLDALRATISVMLQTFYTAQSVIWSK